MFRYKNLLLLLVILIFIVVCTEIVVGTAERLKYKALNNLNSIPKLGYIFISNESALRNYYCTSYSNCDNKMRMPSGTGFRKTPIVIFGSSFAHGGSKLVHTQTLSHKLSSYTRRPVYNRAVQHQGLSFMLWQTENNDFYINVPEADTYIYLFKDDDFRKMLSYKYSPVDSEFLKQYTYNSSTKHLDKVKNNFPFSNFFKSTYILSIYNDYKIKSYLDNTNNADEIASIAVQYLVQSRKNIEEHFNKKVKFVVIIYSKEPISPYQELFRNKLIDEGFIVLDTKRMTEENLYKHPQYLNSNGEPTENAWNLLVPLIVQYADLRMI